MRSEDLLYELPAGAVAQSPIEPRDAARLLVDLPPAGVAHTTVADLPAFLCEGDVLVVNDTRVLRARLQLHKVSGGHVEVLLLAPVAPDRRAWEALVRPGRRVAPGTALVDQSGAVVLTVGGPAGDNGRRLVRFSGNDEIADVLERVGEVPLPPYIRTALTDPERYQTVYSREPASVAAPTAGLHLTEHLLERCRHAGASVVSITLDVGLATFQPITAERVEDHRMHAERYAVPDSAMAACRDAGRVIAVGTTALRALESAASSGELSGSTELFIHGDYRFEVVDVLLTNFHLPGSSLLALLESFVGPTWRELYALALVEGYRFLSFGDAMLVDRR